jgi:hypothetical protein
LEDFPKSADVGSSMSDEVMLPSADPSTMEVMAEHWLDAEQFPERTLIPADTVIINGHEESFIDKIIDQRRRGHQYLVRWRGEGPEGDKWIAAKELEDCEALDIWLQRQNTSTTPQEPVPIYSLLNAAGSFPHRGFDAPVLSAIAPPPSDPCVFITPHFFT